MGVVNSIPEERTPPGLQDLWVGLKKEFGVVLNAAKVMAHRPEAAKAFFHFYDTVLERGTIDPTYKQLAYLKASMVNGCDYCTTTHVALARQVGVRSEQLVDLDCYNQSPAFDAKEKVTLAFAEKVTRNALGVTEEDLENLRRYYDEDEVVELTLVICVANCGNRFTEALHIPKD